MDPYVHTVIATVMLFCSYKLGRYFGGKETWSVICAILLDLYKAESLEITPEGEILVTDANGNERKVN
jgi:hypothetical protein